MSEVAVVGPFFKSISQSAAAVTVVEGIVPPLLAVASEHLVRLIMTSTKQSHTHTHRQHTNTHMNLEYR